MDSFSEQLAHARVSVSDKLAQLYTKIEHHVPDHIESSVREYIANISNTTKDDLLNDLRRLQLTPATITLALVTVPTLLLARRLVSQGSDSSKSGTAKPKHKKKKPSKAQVANKEIQRILDFVEETYVPQIDSYIESYTELSTEDQQYKFKYFEEMLLKELMNLDNVDVAGNDVLRENRKKVIRFVQEHQKRLDTFKREVTEST